MYRILFTLAALTVPMHPQVLEPYRDHYRVVLLFALSPADPRYVRQLALLKHHEAAFKERDLIFLPVVTPPGAAVTARITAPLDDAAQHSLRLTYRIAPGGFAVILIGKDGGEKLRSNKPITPEILNNTIDAMPMRQDEMRRQ